MAGNNILGQFSDFLFPGGNPFYQEDEDTANLKTRAADARRLGTEEGNAKAALLEAEIDAQKTHDIQEYMNIAATAGASSGGPAIGGGGTSDIGYAPQRDITKTFPGAMSKEEEEYQRMLRARVGPSPSLFNLA